jgi:hypothetical protein
MAGTLVVLEGEVQIHRSAGSPRQVRDYARLELGDRVALDTSSRARLSLFDSRSMVLLPGETYRVERQGIVRLRDGVGVQVLPFSVPLGTRARARQFDVDVGGAGTLQVAGEVWVRSNTSQEWSPVNRDREVQLQSWIRTGADGRAVLASGSTGTLLLEQDTLVQLQGRELNLEYGGALIRTRRRSERAEVHTAELRIESTGGVFRVVREAGAGTRVFSFGQRVLVQPRQGRGRLAVHPGMVARVGPSGELLGVDQLARGRTVRDWRIKLRDRLDGVPPGLGERLGYLRELFGLVHQADDVGQPLPRTNTLRAALELDGPVEDPGPQESASPGAGSEGAPRPPDLAPPTLPRDAVPAPPPVAGRPTEVTAPPGTVLAPARSEMGGEASPLMRAPPPVHFDTPSEAPPASLAAPGATPGRGGPTPVKASGDWVVQVETGRSRRPKSGAGIRSTASPPEVAPPPSRRRRRRRGRNPWDAAPSPEDPPPTAVSVPVPRQAPPTAPPPPAPPVRASTPAPPPPPAPSAAPVIPPSPSSFGSDPLGGPSDLARAFQL